MANINDRGGGESQERNASSPPVQSRDLNNSLFHPPITILFKPSLVQHGEANVGLLDQNPSICFWCSFHCAHYTPVLVHSYQGCYFSQPRKLPKFCFQNTLGRQTFLACLFVFENLISQNLLTCFVCVRIPLNMNVWGKQEVQRIQDAGGKKIIGLWDA